LFVEKLLSLELTTMVELLNCYMDYILCDTLCLLLPTGRQVQNVDYYSLFEFGEGTCVRPTLNYPSVAGSPLRYDNNPSGLLGFGLRE